MTSDWNNNPLFNTDGIIGNNISNNISNNENDNNNNDKIQKSSEPLYDNLRPVDNYNHLIRENKIDDSITDESSMNNQSNMHKNPLHNTNPLYNTNSNTELNATTDNNQIEENQYAIINEEIVDKWPLPEGWKELVAPNGKKYYACYITKHTQWLHPAIPVGIPMSNGLPYGWEKAVEPKTNREYFICHVGRFNTLSPPVGKRPYIDN